MVRIDKISYMITCFKSLSVDLEVAQYSDPPSKVNFEKSSLLVMKRIGVISAISFDQDEYKKLLKHIPYGRENFLIKNISNHSDTVCHLDKPDCLVCDMNEKCDYYNQSNEWKEVN